MTMRPSPSGAARPAHATYALPLSTFIVGNALVLNETIVVPCSKGVIGAATATAFVNVLPKSVDLAMRMEWGWLWCWNCRHATYTAPVASSTAIVVPWLIG